MEEGRREERRGVYKDKYVNNNNNNSNNKINRQSAIIKVNYFFL